jgi:hypothetical protein
MNIVNKQNYATRSGQDPNSNLLMKPTWPKRHKRTENTGWKVELEGLQDYLTYSNKASANAVADEPRHNLLRRKHTPCLARGVRGRADHTTERNTQELETDLLKTQPKEKWKDTTTKKKIHKPENVLVCLTACVTRWWVGRENAVLTGPTSNHAKCLKTRRLPPVGCTLCWVLDGLKTRWLFKVT